MRLQMEKTISHIKISMTVIFLLSFLQYFLPVEPIMQLIPVLLLTFLAFMILIISNPTILSRILGELFAPKIFLFILAITLVPIIVSLFSGYGYSVLYGCLMMLTLFSIRVILSVVLIEDVLSSYFYASAIAIPIFAILSVQKLFGAIFENYRFSIFYFHPNLIAFFIGGFIPVQIWKFRTQTKHRFWILALILLGSIILFFSSSRGSIVSILSGGMVISAIYYFKQISIGNLKITGRHFSFAIFLSGLAMIIILFNPIVTDNILWYIADKLDLFSPYRGLGTGLTGRIDNWNFTLYSLKHGSWFLGNGFRSGSSELGFSIDNGYLTLVYEIGLVPAILITTKYIWVTIGFALKYFRAKTFQDTALYLSLIFIMIVFLANNIVARYLFGLGNPFSLLALFFILLFKKDLQGRHWVQTKSKEF
jgi:hypothetical protein